MPNVDDILAELSEGDEQVETEPETEGQTIDQFDVKMVDVDSVALDSENREATEKAVAELAESINKNGLFVPVIVDDKNNLIDGERRLRAVSSLGIRQIPAIVRKVKREAGSVLTNVQRENFTKEYLQKRFKKELRKRGMTQAKLAKKYGLTQGRISQIVGKRKKATKKKAKQKKKLGSKSILNVTGKTVADVAKNISLIVGKKEVRVVFELSNKDLEQPKTALRKLLMEVDFSTVEKVREDVQDLK